MLKGCLGRNARDEYVEYYSVCSVRNMSPDTEIYMSFHFHFHFHLYNFSGTTIVAFAIIPELLVIFCCLSGFFSVMKRSRTTLIAHGAFLAFNSVLLFVAAAYLIDRGIYQKQVIVDLGSRTDDAAVKEIALYVE